MAKVKGRKDVGGGYTEVQSLKKIKREEAGQLALESLRVIFINLLLTGRLSFIPRKRRKAK